MYTMGTVTVLMTLFLLVSGKSEENSKRFILDSTDGSVSRLAQLEGTVQILLHSVNRLNSSVLELLSRNLLLENANNLQDGLIHELQNTISNLQVKDIQYQSMIASLKDAISHSQIVTQTLPTTPTQEDTTLGSTYIRWGKRHCSGHNTELVYSGYGGGQYYSGNYGGPGGMLCLPEDPDITNETTTTTSSYIYGMEYQENIFSPDAVNEDVPCAFCRSKYTHTSDMIPGRMTCYAGWKREYYGHLASGATGQTSSDYICIDISPDFTAGGKDSKPGKQLYTSSSNCGSLPCPPYKQAIPLYCVVCSK